MSQKFTAEEVRAEADFLSTYSRKPSQMLTAYADSIERAQPTDSGRVELGALLKKAANMLDRAAELGGNPDLRNARHECAAELRDALAAQSQGEPVAWRWRDSVRPGLPWYLTDSADYAKQLRQSDMYVVEDLYLAPSAPEGES